MDGEFKDSQGNTITRIGLLAPDNKWEEFMTLLQSLHQISDNKDRIEWVASTHVPPYGYGRNHGLSRIIRFVERIPYHAYELIADHTLSSSYSAAEMYEVQVIIPLFSSIESLVALPLTLLYLFYVYAA